MLKSTWTNIVHGDSDYFDSLESAVHRHPLTLLDDVRLESADREREVLRGLPSSPPGLSLLDVVATFVIEHPLPELLAFPVSESLVRDCRIAGLQKLDYTLEVCWTMYEWQGREWLYNSVTEEWFYVDASWPWEAYMFHGSIWWLNGKRWFWETTETQIEF